MPKRKNNPHKEKKKKKTSKSRAPKARIIMAINNLVVAENNVEDSPGGRALSKEITKAAVFLGKLQERIV